MGQYICSSTCCTNTTQTALPPFDVHNHRSNIFLNNNQQSVSQYYSGRQNKSGWQEEMTLSLSRADLELHLRQQNHNLTQLAAAGLHPPRDLSSLRKFYIIRQIVQQSDPKNAYKSQPPKFGGDLLDASRFQLTGNNSALENNCKKMRSNRKDFKSIETQKMTGQTSVQGRRGVSIQNEMWVDTHSENEEMIFSPFSHTNTGNLMPRPGRDAKAKSKSTFTDKNKINNHQLNHHKQVRYRILQQKRQRNDSRESSNHLRERYKMKNHFQNAQMQFQNNELFTNQKNHWANEIKMMSKNQKPQNLRSSSQNLLTSSSNFKHQVLFGDKTQFDSVSQGLAKVKLQNMKNIVVPQVSSIEKINEHTFHYQSSQNKKPVFYSNESGIQNQLSSQDPMPSSECYAKSINTEGQDIQRQASIFQKIRESIKSKQTYPKKQNIKFFDQFKMVYQEISSDLIERIEEIQQIRSLCQFASEFQHQKDEQFQKTKKPNKGGIQNQMQDWIENNGLQQQNTDTDNSRQSIINDSTLQILGINENKCIQISYREKKSRLQASEMTCQNSQSCAVKTIYDTLMEQLLWENLDQALCMVDNLLSDQEMYFEQARYATNKSKEKELILKIYQIVSQIDELIGKFEIDISEALGEKMDEYVQKQITKYSERIKIDASATGEAQSGSFSQTDVILSPCNQISLTNQNKATLNTNKESNSKERPSSFDRISQCDDHDLSKNIKSIVDYNRSQLRHILGVTDKKFKNRRGAQTPVDKNKQFYSVRVIDNPDGQSTAPKTSRSRRHKTQELLAPPKSARTSQRSMSIKKQRHSMMVTQYNQMKTQLFREKLLQQINIAQNDLASLKKTSNPNVRKQQLIQQNLSKLRNICEENALQPEGQRNPLNFMGMWGSLITQSIEIHKERHLYQLWKIHQIQQVSDQQNQQNFNLKKQMISEILEDLDQNISHTDFEYEEMREQQLCVDLSIEQYFKKIDHYPKSLKRLFDMGTSLLSSFDNFYQAWYTFQCELQQKLYNYIYSNEQELQITQLQTEFQLKQLETVIMHYHNLMKDYWHIKGVFYKFQIEILSQNQALYAEADVKRNMTVGLFEQIGVMDVQGVGSLIFNNASLINYEETSNELEILDINDAELPISSPLIKNFDYQKQIEQHYKKQDCQDQQQKDQQSQVDQAAKQLCEYVAKLNDMSLAIKRYFSQLDNGSKRFQSTCIESASQRHSLNSQIMLTFQEFLTQQFDQIYQYSNIQKFIQSADSHSKGIIKGIPDNLVNEQKVRKNIEVKQKQKQEYIYKHNGVFKNKQFVGSDDFNAQNHSHEQTQSFSDPITPSPLNNIIEESRGRYKVEFDLILNICGLQLNLISLIKSTDFQNQGISKDNRGRICQREWFLNLNYLSNHWNPIQQSARQTQNSFRNTTDEPLQFVTPRDHIDNLEEPLIYQSPRGLGSVTRVISHVLASQNSWNIYQSDQLQNGFIDQKEIVQTLNKKWVGDDTYTSRMTRQGAPADLDRLPFLQSSEVSARTDQNKLPMQLLPLDIALHHLLQTDYLVQLFDGIKYQCLREIQKMISKIEQQIPTTKNK